MKGYTKPPLGATPKKIHNILRIQELCRALYEYSNYEPMKIDLMYEWNSELTYLLEEISESTTPVYRNGGL